MNEKIPQNFQELLAKVEEFEKTVTGLLDNIKRFKSRILENKKKYGPDTSKWPANKENTQIPGQ
jgi:hypothetical protein